MAERVEIIKTAARELGFEVLAVTDTSGFDGEIQALRKWSEAGYAADMQYMKRDPELLGNPTRLLPAGKSLITLAVNYYTEAPRFTHENRFGRVARYAWGLDYHDVVRPRLLELVSRIERIAGRRLDSRCFVDAVPLLERAAAARAGLGFIGKNTNLLQPKRGSWFFLCEILIDLDLPQEGEPVRVGCGSCHRCIDACPTGAFAEPFVLDSRRCISYLTIENRGAIPVELRPALGEWVFGCDVCQDVCPFNRFSETTMWPELGPSAGAGERLDLAGLLGIATDEGFRSRFHGTPLIRPRRRGLVRNAAVVAANISCTAAVPALSERIAEDPEPLIRSHSLWALSKLDHARARIAAEKLITDPDDSVREEARRILE